MVGWAADHKNLSRDADKRFTAEQQSYYDARMAGIQPDGTTNAKIRFADRMSQQFGAAYGEDFRVIPKSDRTGYDAVFKKDSDRIMSEIKAEDHEVVRDAAKTFKGLTGKEL